MARLRSFALFLLCASASAQDFSSVEPVALSSITNGNEVSRLSSPERVSPIYSDAPDVFFDDDATPEGFESVIYFRTKLADRNTTTSDLFDFDIDQDAEVCVWHADEVGSRPAWLASRGYTDSGIDWLNAGEGEDDTNATFSGFCADKSAGTINIGGNTTSGVSTWPMHFVTVRPYVFKTPYLAAAPGSQNGEYRFTQTSYSIDESTSSVVATVERINGTDDAVTVDVTEGAGSTCAGPDHTFTDPTTISCPDGIGGTCGGVSFTANAVTGNCTVDLEFTNPTGGWSAGSTAQTTTVTINNDAAPAALKAMPYCEGWGCNATGGRGGAVIKVTNTNNSGAGSLRACIEATGPRNCVFEVSGTIALSSRLTIRDNQGRGDLTIWGQSAPGDGIVLRNTQNDITMVLGAYSGGGSPATNIIIQHLRFRHGAPATDGKQSDNLNIWGPASDIVIDHNSFTWSSDENVTLWSNGPHNITFSNNIFAEGIVKEDLQTVSGGVPEFQNMGVLMSGGNGSIGQYQISFHHNLFAHNWKRAPRINIGSQGNPGIEWINNIHYNTAEDNFRITFKEYTGSSDIRLDIVNELFIQGPESAPNDPWPVQVSRQNTSGPFGDLDIHFTGSADLLVDGVTSTIRDDQADNYNMIQVESSTSSCSSGCAVVERGSRFSTQPEFPVVADSLATIRTDMITNADVGALPHDTVDSRIVCDVEDGDGWSAANVPAPKGTGAYPTMSSDTYPTDTDDDGVPDSYETGVLSSDENVSDSDDDHNADGYTNLEDYMYSISGSGALPTPGHTCT